MARPQCIRINVLLIVRMKQARLGAARDGLESRRICEPEDAPVGLLAGGTHDGNALREHLLVGVMGMQVSGAHETCLGGVRMDPSEDHQVLGIAELPNGGLIHGFTGIRRRLLLGNEEL